MNTQEKSRDDDQSARKKYAVAAILDQQALEYLARKIAGITGFAFALTNYRGDEYTCVNYCNFCLAAREGPCPICTAANATNAFGIAQASVTEKPFIYFCPYGLLIAAVPIIVDGQYLGGFIAGQVRCEDAPADTVHLKNVLPYNRDFLQDDAIRRSFDAIAVIPYQKFMDATDLMAFTLYQMIDRQLAQHTGNDSARLTAALQAERERRQEAEGALASARLTALRAQLNPYYLMSTLSALANLAIVENAPQTNELAAASAQFLAELLKKHDETSTLGAEMDRIGEYLRIQQTCMGGKLSYRVVLDDSMRRQPIPILLLHPFVERAVYQGAARKAGGGCVTVAAAYDGDDVLIRVENDGPEPSDRGQDGSEPENFAVTAGTGLAQRRMKHHFGSHYTLDTKFLPGRGTVCTLRYPRFYEKGGM